MCICSNFIYNGDGTVFSCYNCLAAQCGLSTCPCYCHSSLILAPWVPMKRATAQEE